MTTKLLRAGRLSVTDRLVVQGKRRREALPICELVQNGQIVSAVVRELTGELGRRTFDVRDQVRVVDR